MSIGGECMEALYEKEIIPPLKEKIASLEKEVERVTGMMNQFDFDRDDLMHENTHLKVYLSTVISALRAMIEVEPVDFKDESRYGCPVETCDYIATIEWMKSLANGVLGIVDPQEKADAGGDE